ncbi:MAG: hypothetical protein ACYS3S_10145 [Planctomycetota bacterium]
MTIRKKFSGQHGQLVLGGTFAPPVVLSQGIPYGTFGSVPRAMPDRGVF